MFLLQYTLALNASTLVRNQLILQVNKKLSSHDF